MFASIINEDTIKCDGKEKLVSKCVLITKKF